MYMYSALSATGRGVVCTDTAFRFLLRVLAYFPPPKTKFRRPIARPRRKRRHSRNAPADAQLMRANEEYRRYAHTRALGDGRGYTLIRAHHHEARGLVLIGAATCGRIAQREDSKSRAAIIAGLTVIINRRDEKWRRCARRPSIPLPGTTLVYIFVARGSAF